MYYTGNSGPWRILSAVSSDQLTWTKEAGIRVDVGGGACDSVQAYSSEIFNLPNGTFRMYYTGYNGGFCILSAWSASGLTWIKEPGARVAAGGPYDTNGPLSPHVVELVNGSLRMYYTGSDGSTFRILSAISTDGLAWSKEAGIRVDRGGAYDAAFVDSAETVLLPDGRVRMYYHGNDGSRSRILSAITSNGLIWTKDPGIRIDAGGPYDGAGVGYPDVVPDLFGGYRMFYGGSDGAALRILSAVNQAPTYAEWDFDVDVDTDGDLIPDNDVEATDLLASHTYWDDGVYSAKVCVTSANETACDVTNTSVTNLSPTASVDVAAASEGTIMNVNVTAMDPGSDDLTIEWFWQFLSGGNAVHYNDGSGPDPPHSSDGIAPFVIGTRVSENYTDDGSYMLYLNVTDDDGGVSSFVLGVSVSNSVPISVSLVGVPDIPVGQTRDFFSTATDMGSDDLTFEWQWGDLTSNLTTYYNGGGPDPRPSPGGTAPFQVIDVQGHSWTSVGTYSIVLRVSDDDGAVVQASLSVQVHPLPTTVMILGTPRYGGAPDYITSLTDILFSATDYSGFGIVRTEYRIDGGSWSTYTVGTPVQLASEGLHLVEYRSIDGIGGIGISEGSSVAVDNTAPEVAVSFGPPSVAGVETWVTPVSPVSLQTTDAGVVPVGVDEHEFRLWFGVWSLWISYATPFSLVGEGRHFIEVRASDLLGNTRVANSTVIVDATGPTSFAVLQGIQFAGETTFVRASALIVLSALDRAPIPVGLGTIESRIDGLGLWGSYSGPISLDSLSQGPHFVEYRSVDLLGNMGNQDALGFFVDETPPESSATIVRFVQDTASVNFTSADYGCGVEALNFSLDMGPWQVYVSNFTVSGYGVHNVRYRASDCLGNVESEQSVLVSIPAAEPNYKIVIAIAFALIFVVVALIRRRSLPTGRTRAFLAATAGFVLAESLTGVISLFTGLLSVPPLFGIGLAVDLVILVGGVGVLLTLSRRSESVLDPPPPE